MAKSLLVIFKIICSIPLLIFAILLSCYLLYEYFELYHQQNYLDLIGYVGPFFSLCLSPVWLILISILLYKNEPRKVLVPYSIIYLIFTLLLAYASIYNPFGWQKILD